MYVCINRRSCLDVFVKKLFLRPAVLLKKRLWHKCFLVKFAKFSRTPFFIEDSDGCFWIKKWMNECIVCGKYVVDINLHCFPFQTLKVNWLKSHETEVDPGVFVLLFCGTAASTCGQIASYPLALVRTKLQAQSRFFTNFYCSQLPSIF